MDTRLALFDLYADHLHPRGGEVPVAALVRLVAPLGVAAPALRTAVSRMARQGWLAPVRVASAPGYRLTEQSLRRLSDRGERERRAESLWDGQWHLLVVTPPEGRAARDRYAAGLRALGYGPLGESSRIATWVAPRDYPGVDDLLVHEHARAERFQARHDGDSTALVARAWDIDALGRAYLRFLADGASDAGSYPTGAATGKEGAAAFAQRAHLVRQWRTLQAMDPGLPLALLPPAWPGGKAADHFAAEAARLLPGATEFVTSCLRPAEQGPPL